MSSVTSFDKAAAEELERHENTCRDLAPEDVRAAARDLTRTCFGQRQSRFLNLYTTSEDYGLYQVNFPVLLDREIGSLPVDICECLLDAGFIAAKLSRETDPHSYTLTTSIRASSFEEVALMLEAARSLVNVR